MFPWCIGELSKHWFTYQVGAYLKPSHCLIKCWFIVKSTLRIQKQTSMEFDSEYEHLFKKMHMKMLFAKCKPFFLLDIYISRKFFIISIPRKTNQWSLNPNMQVFFQEYISEDVACKIVSGLIFFIKLTENVLSGTKMAPGIRLHILWCDSLS